MISHTKARAKANGLELCSMICNSAQRSSCTVQVLSTWSHIQLLPLTIFYSILYLALSKDCVMKTIQSQALNSVKTRPLDRKRCDAVRYWPNHAISLLSHMPLLLLLLSLLLFPLLLLPLLVLLLLPPLQNTLEVDHDIPDAVQVQSLSGLLPGRT